MSTNKQPEKQKDLAKERKETLMGCLSLIILVAIGVGIYTAFRSQDESPQNLNEKPLDEQVRIAARVLNGRIRDVMIIDYVDGTKKAIVEYKAPVTSRSSICTYWTKAIPVIFARVEGINHLDLRAIGDFIITNTGEEVEEVAGWVSADRKVAEKIHFEKISYEDALSNFEYWLHPALRE